MIAGKSVIAVVPARAGSKGLPGKNIRPLCGKPLISWTIEAGLASRYVDDVLVSTDCQTTADIALKAGVSVPFMRPAVLASDTASSVDVVLHTLDFYRQELLREFDLVVLLEPTSPLRQADDIDSMLEKLVSRLEEFDAIISLGEVHTHPSIMKRLSGDQIEQFNKDLVMSSRRQDQAVAYFPFGVAYIVKAATLYAGRTFYPTRTTYQLIERYQCYEIDDIYDFLAIENIMRYEWRTP